MQDATRITNRVIRGAIERSMTSSESKAFNIERRNATQRLARRSAR